MGRDLPQQDEGTAGDVPPGYIPSWGAGGAGGAAGAAGAADGTDGTDGTDGRFVGSFVNTSFGDLGYYVGLVAAYNPEKKLYLVLYVEDGDWEECTADEVNERIVDVPYRGVFWYHTRVEYVNTKNPPIVPGAFYYIEMSETELVAGVAGIFVATESGYKPHTVTNFDSGHKTYRHHGQLTRRKSEIAEAKKRASEALGIREPQLCDNKRKREAHDSESEDIETESEDESGKCGF